MPHNIQLIRMQENCHIFDGIIPNLTIRCDFIPAEISRRCKFPSPVLEVLFSDCLAKSEPNFSLSFNFEVNSSLYSLYKIYNNVCVYVAVGLCIFYGMV